MVSFARGTRALRRASFDARSGRPSRPPSREGKTSKLGGIIFMRNVLVRRPRSGLTRVSVQRRLKEQAWKGDYPELNFTGVPISGTLLPHNGSGVQWEKSKFPGNGLLNPFQDCYWGC